MQRDELNFENNIVLCICEGNAETDIIDILLDNNMLIFTRDMLFEKRVLRRESVDRIQDNYLSLDYGSKLPFILRIIDSKHEAFKLREPYKTMYKSRINTFCTSPEIEILIIYDKKDIKCFNKENMKPSVYCKANYGLRDIKKKGFMKEYFKNQDDLLEAIINYEKCSSRDKLSLYNLLNKEYRFD